MPSELYEKLQEYRGLQASSDEEKLSTIDLSITMLRQMKSVKDAGQAIQQVRRQAMSFMPMVPTEAVTALDMSENFTHASLVETLRQRIRYLFTQLGVSDGFSPPIMPMVGGASNPVNIARAGILDIPVDEYVELVESPTVV